MAMYHGKHILAIGIDIKCFLFPNCNAFVRAISFTLWTDVPGGRASVDMTYSSVITADPAYLISSLIKLLSSVHHITSALDKWMSLKSGLILWRWISIQKEWCRVCSRSGSGSRVEAFKHTDVSVLDCRWV